MGVFGQGHFVIFYIHIIVASYIEKAQNYQYIIMMVKFNSFV